MLTAYLDRLNNADWDGFRGYFTDDATAFSPWAEFADRATGRECVLDAFRPAFARWRATMSGPPYLRIVPEDLHIQQLDDVAIVTFHARDEPSLGRRTLVIRNGPDGWKSSTCTPRTSCPPWRRRLGSENEGVCNVYYAHYGSEMRKRAPYSAAPARHVTRYHTRAPE